MPAKITVAAVYVVVMFITMLDTTIVNVAIPDIARSFGVAPADGGAIVVAFVVSLGLAMPIAGWLEGRFGGKRVLLTAIVVFAAASWLCAAATSLPELVAFRALQGAAGGVLSPVGLSMFLHAYTGPQRAHANRVLMVPMVIAPAVGPVLGGVLVDGPGWGWIFLVNVPIAGAAVLVGALFLPQADPGQQRIPLDLVGFLTIGIGVALVMFAVSTLAADGRPTVSSTTAFAAGVVLLIVHVVRARGTLHPVVPFRLLHDRFLQRCLLAMIPSYMAYSALLFVVPVALQSGRGVSATLAGLGTFPEAIGVLLSTQLAAPLLLRAGPRSLIAGGLTAAAALIAGLGWAVGAAPIVVIGVLMFLIGNAMAFTMLPSQTAAFATIAPTDNAQASTLWSLVMQLSSATGVAASGLSVTLQGGQASAYTSTIGGIVVLTGVAAVTATAIPGRSSARVALAGRPSTSS